MNTSIDYKGKLHKLRIVISDKKNIYPHVDKLIRKHTPLVKWHYFEIELKLAHLVIVQDLNNVN